MFSFRPMRKKATGRWDYVVLDHLGKPEPVGCCREYWDKGHKEGHHPTAEAAAKAFKEYLYEMIRLDGTTFVAAKCAVCGNTTFRGAVLDDGTHGEPVMVAHLCQRHLTRDCVYRLVTDKPIYSEQETFDKEDRESAEADPSEWENQSDELT